MLDLYKNIKKYRELRNISQEELAKKVGYANRSAIARIEKGEIDLPQSKIIAIADALGVPAGSLMGSTEINTDDILYSEIKSFNEIQKQMLADQIEFIKKYGNDTTSNNIIKSKDDFIREIRKIDELNYEALTQRVYEAYLKEFQSSINDDMEDFLDVDRNQKQQA